MTFDAQMLPRVLRDVTDGVMLLDLHGTVMYVNPSGMRILALDNRVIGQKYAPTMIEGGVANDSFHQFLLDAVYDKGNAHHGSCDYYCPTARPLSSAWCPPSLKTRTEPKAKAL